MHTQRYKKMDTQFIKSNAPSLRQSVISMNVGDQIEVMEESISTLRHYSSLFSRLMNREYHTRRIASRGVYVITREA